MNDALYRHTTNIMDCAHTLLSERKGSLSDKQRHFTKTIIANAERFLMLCYEYETVPLEELTSDVRHEFGNTLTPVTGYSDLLTMVGTLNDDQLEFVNQICDSTRELRLMIDAIMQEARQLAALKALEVPA